MSPTELLPHFERISEAREAVPRLRQFILDLAVRGRLTDQDPNDEPASELIKRIDKERDRLVQLGKIKAHDPQPPVSNEELGFVAPPQWECVRIGDLLTVIRGASPRPKGDPKYFSAKRTPYRWIKISDIRKHSKDGVLYDADEFLTEAGMRKSVMLPKDTLVVTNSATIGVPIFLGFEGGCIHDGYLAFPYFPEKELSKEYFFVLFQTLQSYAVKKARGMAQLNLNTSLVREFPIGLPPLAEQLRIISKVGELMMICDRLEAGRVERELIRDHLATASLRELDRGAEMNDDGVVRIRAGFYLNHLSSLTGRTEHIRQLRQTLLNLAVRGRLAPQDFKEEAAVDLLNRIRSRKSHLAKAGALRSANPIPPISEEECPFALPSNWCWARIGDCATLTEYGTSMKSDDADDGVPVLKMGDIQGGRVLLGGQKKVPANIDDLPQLFLKRFDLLYNRTNSAELVGKTGIYLGEDDAYTFASYLIRIRFFNDLIDPEYVNIAMNAPYFRVTQILPELKQQCGQANVNGTKLRSMLIPIPPLGEQHRVLTKVNEVMALCDELEERLADSQTESRRLLEAVLHRALEPSPLEEALVTEV